MEDHLKEDATQVEEIMGEIIQVKMEDPLMGRTPDGGGPPDDGGSSDEGGPPNNGRHPGGGQHPRHPGG